MLGETRPPPFLRLHLHLDLPLLAGILLLAGLGLSSCARSCASRWPSP